MRSLPWLVKKEQDQNDDSSQSNNPRKRKRNTNQESKPVKAESPELPSDSDETVILDPALDVPGDAMIPGYDNDDAYIMVEHDLLEAAKQVTRHFHLEAYQKHATAPVVDGEIIRPTTGAPKRVHSRNVHETLEVDAVSDEEEGEGMGKDVTSLGQLLRRRPAALVPATPIKRQQRSQPQLKKENRSMESRKNIQEKKMEREVPRPPSRGAEADDEDEDEDDEDLDRPRKVLNLITPADRQISKPSMQSSLSSSVSSAAPSRPPVTRKDSTNKPSMTLEPDWIFSSLWGDDSKRPTKPAVLKRGKVSFADQLQESTFKMFEKKKAISLKDQFKFMET